MRLFGHYLYNYYRNLCKYIMVQYEHKLNQVTCLHPIKHLNKFCHIITFEPVC